MRRAGALIAVVVGLCIVSGHALLAQSYPNRPIRLFVSFPPGGAADLVARVVGQPLKQGGRRRQ